MAITFTALRTFHAVAKEQSFSAAARTLRIGQPTVSKQIKDIEIDYRVELFVRGGRKIRLTEAGALLYDIARRVVQLREEAHEHLGMLGKIEGGQFRLAAVGPRRATDMLAVFKRRYPNIRVSVMLGNSESSLNRLFELEADVAVVARKSDDERVRFIHYRADEVVLLVSKEHKWFGRKSIKLAEVAGQPFILREKESTTRTALHSALKKAGISINPVFEIGSREGVSHAVGSGFGIGAVASFEFTDRTDLHAVRIRDFPILINYYIAHLAEREKSPKIQAFVDLLRKKSGA